MLWLLGGALVGLLATSAIESALADGVPRADWTHTAVGSATSGLTAEYPSAWHAFAYGENRESLVIASFPLSADWPQRARKSVPHGGIYIWAFTYGPLPESPSIARGFPPRPRRFELTAREHGFFGCGFGLEGYAIRFRERGMAIQAMVALGEGARREDAESLLDKLMVRPGLRPNVPQI